MWWCIALSWNERDSVLSGSHIGESVLAPVSGNVKREKECWEMNVFIENTCHGVSSKNARRNWSGGRSFEHWPRGSPGQWVPKTECLRASAIFVSGKSGITSILNYRSISPIIPRKLWERIGKPTVSVIFWPSTRPKNTIPR